MSSNPFANATPTPNLAADSQGNAPPADDLDFSADVPALQLGLFDAHCHDVKLATGDHAGKLIIEFMIDEGPKDQKVAFWGDPNDQQSMIGVCNVVNALGVEIVNHNGKNVPSCGWLGLKDRACRVAVDAYQGKYQIPRFGKIRHDDCPEVYKNRDFGCGVLAPGSE